MDYITLACSCYLNLATCITQVTGGSQIRRHGYHRPPEEARAARGLNSSTRPGLPMLINSIIFAHAIFCERGQSVERAHLNRSETAASS